MGPFATVVLAGCLEALRWFFWGTAGLVVVAIIAQYWRRDEAASPLGLAAMALVFVVAGAICHRVAAAVSRKGR